ncbi:MAG: hypothetical protein NVSMB26_25430 [Beijerinckiaceae bacterium]
MILVANVAALADAPKLTPMPPPQAVPIQAYGQQSASCREWTDGCTLCTKADNGETNCSTPGIACQPAGLHCKKSDR